MEEHPIEVRRKELGLSRRKLAHFAGVSDGYLTLIAQGKRKGPAYGIAVRLAKVLRTTPEFVMGVAREKGARRPITDILEELGQVASGLESVEIPIMGSMPGRAEITEPADSEVVCKKYLSLSSIGHRNDLFALKVNGGWLESEGIADNDLIIVEANRKIEEGKLYLVVRDGMTTVVKAELYGDSVTICALDGKNASGLEVVGRVILSGHWRKHD